MNTQASAAPVANLTGYQGHGNSGGVCLHSQGALYPYIIGARECGIGHPAAAPGKSYAYYAFYGNTASPLCTYEVACAVAEVAVQLAGGPSQLGHEDALRLSIQDAQEADLFPVV